MLVDIEYNNGLCLICLMKIVLSNCFFRKVSQCYKYGLYVSLEITSVN